MAMESHRDYAEQETNDSLSCINFTTDSTAETLRAIKLSLSPLAIAANLVVIILIFLTKKAKKFMMYRLVLYLMIIDIFQAIDIIIVSLPITVMSDEAFGPIVKPGWANACIALGFFSVMTLWMGNIIIFWIALYLAWIGCCLYRRTQNHHIKDFSWHPRMSEGVCVIFLLVLVPVIIAMIPLFVGNMYGPSGLGCWIRFVDRVCGDLEILSLMLDLTLFYAPLIVIFVFTTLSSCIAVTCCCRGGVRRHDAIVSLRKSNMKDIIVVLVIPLVYCAVCLLLLTTYENAVYSNSYPRTPLWMTHEVADSFRVILPALTYLLNPLVWSDIRHVCTCTPTQDSLQPLHSLKEGSNKDYGACDDSTVEGDDDITDDEYVRSLLKVKRKT